MPSLKPFYLMLSNRLCADLIIPGFWFGWIYPRTKYVARYNSFSESLLFWYFVHFTYYASL